MKKSRRLMLISVQNMDSSPPPTGAAAGILVEAAEDGAGRMTDNRSGLD
jgi:hypothetical protein